MQPFLLHHIFHYTHIFVSRLPGHEGIQHLNELALFVVQMLLISRYNNEHVESP
jgi:hypothetical protein